MCRLFGILASEEVDIRFSMLGDLQDSGFRNLAAAHPHGWGFGYVKNGTTQVLKEPASALVDANFQEVVERLRSHCILGHIRQATVGAQSLFNTHPFVCNRWVFAHNGTILEGGRKRLRSNLRRFSPQGDSDSELLFLNIVGLIDEGADPVTSITETIRPIVQDGQFKSLNFLLTDGLRYYAYRMISPLHPASKWTLYYLLRTRHAKIIGATAKSGLTVRLKEGAKERFAAILISSEMLTKEQWIPLELNELLILSRIGANDFKLREIQLEL